MRPSIPEPDAIERPAPRRQILVRLGACALWPQATRAASDDPSEALTHEPAGLTLHNGWILRPADR